MGKETCKGRAEISLNALEAKQDIDLREPRVVVDAIEGSLHLSNHLHDLLGVKLDHSSP